MTLLYLLIRVEHMETVSPVCWREPEISRVKDVEWLRVRLSMLRSTRLLFWIIPWTFTSKRTFYTPTLHIPMVVIKATHRMQRKLTVKFSPIRPIYIFSPLETRTVIIVDMEPAANGVI